jgi:hypothetical protein
MVIDEIRAEIMNSLYAYDFSTAFPVGYTGAKAVTIVRGWPYDLIDNMLAETDGQMTMPIVSVLDSEVIDTHRSLGNVSTVGAPVGMTRRATRVEANYLIGCWADRRLGGADTAEKLGGLVIGWAFLNQASLTAYRQLRTSVSHTAFHDRPQLWRYDVTLTGHALLTYDS